MSHVIDLKRIVPAQNPWGGSDGDGSRVRTHHEGPGAYEFMDRENYNTPCLGTFEDPPVKSPAYPAKAAMVGRRFIMAGWVDKRTMLPVILTCSFVNGYHLGTKSSGSFHVDACLLETL